MHMPRPIPVIPQAVQTLTRAPFAFCGMVPAHTQGVYADASVGGNLDSLTVSLGINVCGEILGQKVKHCVQSSGGIAQLSLVQPSHNEQRKGPFPALVHA